jgi:hypothetical protein
MITLVVLTWNLSQLQRRWLDFALAAALDSLELLCHEASDNLAQRLARIYTARKELDMKV